MAPKPKLVDDPNTFIPPAVRRQAKQADALFRAARGEPPEPEAGTPKQPPTAPSTPEVPPPAPPPPDTNQPTPSSEPAPVQPPPQEAAQVTPQVTTPPEEDWERRYKSMEGRYKRAEGDILAMSNQLASMQNLIASMQRPVTTETPPELRPQSLLTPEEISEYGTDFLGVVEKKAKDAFSPEVTALRTQLTRLENQMKGSAEASRAQATITMEATLDSKLPQWRDINVMPEFHAWLALPDMYSGAIKHELLRAAYAQCNTPRVLAFFKGFLDQEAAYVPQREEPHQVQDDKVPLVSFAAPGRAKTAAASPAPAEKPIITRAQISQFYADSAAGKWRGREAEKNRLEAMIFEAEREGRIR